MSSIRHFLDLEPLDSKTLRWILDQAVAYKKDWERKDFSRPEHRVMVGKNVVLIFEWPATRTRMHFELATRDVGGGVVSFSANDMQLSRGETVADTARTLSRHFDVIAYRTGQHEKLLEFAEFSQAPVINACTNYSHPFRILLELMTYEEHRGPISGRKVTFLGNCTQNHVTSYMHAAVRLGFTFCISGPPGFEPRSDVFAWAQGSGGKVFFERDARRAIEGCDYVVTDTWKPMGTDLADDRRNALAPYQVNGALMALAKPDALFMHPLPAYRGQEVTAEVIDGPQSVTWLGGIENKRHILKAIFLWFFR